MVTLRKGEYMEHDPDVSSRIRGGGGSVKDALGCGGFVWSVARLYVRECVGVFARALVHVAIATVCVRAMACSLSKQPQFQLFC